MVDVSVLILAKNEEYKRQCKDHGMVIITQENGLRLEEFENAANAVYDHFKDQWGDMPDLIRSVKPEKSVADFQLDV